MTLHTGDCLEVMATMEPESVDAIVTDPPYGLEFMGKQWDRLAVIPDRGQGPRGRNPYAGWHGTASQNPAAVQAWHQQWAEAAYRVAKPSAYLLAFGGTRTVHRMTVALEDAGWIIRDMLVWAYASGFPKSKASLKPAWEPIVMVRKPGPLRELAIDACRIPGNVPAPTRGAPGAAFSDDGYKWQGAMQSEPSPLGRWPANVLLSDPIFDGGVEGVVGGGEANRWFSAARRGDGKAVDGTVFTEHTGDGIGYGDSGTYSRFFLIPKADRADREPVLGGLPQGLGPVISQARRGRCIDCGHWKERAAPNVCPCGGQYEYESNAPKVRQNVHPTVKPVDLMRHLVRLVTPTGGTVLDPFLGSGTTAIAAEMEGFAWIGIEREAEYVAIAEARLNGTQRGLGLDVPAPTPPMPNTHPDLSKHQPKQRAPSENYSGRWAGTEEETA